MASKKTLIEELITLPWWFNLILAVITYAFLKYWIPSIEFQSPLFSGVARALPNLAWILATLLIFAATISAFHSWRKGELIRSQTSVQSIRDLSWKEFEYLVSEAYRRQGFQVTENYGSGADGGVDLTLTKGTDKILVQCKNWKLNKVGVQVVRELFGIVTSERATKGVVVCSNSFTKEAAEFAKRNSIELITGSELRKMVASVQDKTII